VAGLVAIIALGAVLFFALGDDDEPTPAAESTSSATTSSSSSSSSSTSRSSTSSPSPAPAPGAGEDLLAILPVDFTDCTEADPQGDGDIAHASCGASTTQPGPQQAEFFLYPDQETLDSVFDTDTSGAPAIPEGQTCADTTGVGTWTSSGNSGSVACAINADNGQVGIIWTDDNALVEGIVAASGSTQEDLAALYEWWTTNSGYQL
jgi:hypothetical protein